MKNPTDMGMNRSGLATAPVMAPSMLEVPSLTHPSHQGDEALIADERIAYSSGADDYIRKPFCPDQFVACVEALMEDFSRTGGA